MTAVVDAGAAVDLVLDRAGSDAIAAALGAHADDLHAPELFVCECASALSSLVRRDGLPMGRAADALQDVLDLDISRHPHDALVAAVWELRENFSTYDAFYVVLGQALGSGAAIITSDLRLARASETHTDLEVLTP